MRGWLRGEGLGFAIGESTLAFDAAQMRQAGKVRRVGGRCDEARPAPLGAVVSLFERLVGRQIASRGGGLESAQRTGQQRRVVALEFESVMGARRANALGHFGVAVQGVGGDDTAFQIKALQHFQRRGDLVAVRARARRDRHPRFGVPDAHHQRRHMGAPALVAAPQSLAVDGHDALGRSQAQSFAQRPRERQKGAAQRVWIEQAKQARETIMARRAMRQVDDLAKIALVRLGEIGNIHHALGPAQSRHQRNEQHRTAIVPRVQVTRVLNVAQNRNQRFHRQPPESGSHLKNRFLASAQYPYAQMRFPCRERGEGKDGAARSSPRLRYGIHTSLRIVSMTYGATPRTLWKIRTLYWLPGDGIVIQS